MKMLMVWFASAHAMIIVLLVMLATIWSSVSSTRLPPLEKAMRSTLLQVMKCPEWAMDEDMEQPVAAFSPARYMQLVAIVRKDSKENSCGRRSMLPFHLNDPRTWDFCGMGVCSYESCSCFKDFVGEKCNKFQGKCWLFYCRLMGCNKELPSLFCSCNPSLYGTPVTREIYFYDHGFERNYVPPPPGYLSTAFVDSHLIRQTASGRFEIIGGNYYAGTPTRTNINSRYGGKRRSYSLPRLKYNFKPQESNELDLNQNVQYRNVPQFRKSQSNYDRNKFIAEEPQKQAIRPDGYNYLGAQDYTRNKFYNVNPYKRNEKRNDVVDYDEKLPSSLHPSLNYDENRYNFHPRKAHLEEFQPDITARRPNRAQRTETGAQIRSYTENTANEDSQYSNHELKKFQRNWQTNEQRFSYPIRKSLGNFVSNRDDWRMRNYPSDPKYNSRFANIDENRRRYFDADDYRSRRQKLEPSEELSTMVETFGDDEEEEEEERFKYVSGTLTNRFPIINILLYSAITIFLFNFLE